MYGVCGQPLGRPINGHPNAVASPSPKHKNDISYIGVPVTAKRPSTDTVFVAHCKLRSLALRRMLTRIGTMPVCTTKLVGDCASADGADGTEVSKKCSLFCTLLLKYVIRSCSEYVIPA